MGKLEWSSGLTWGNSMDPVLDDNRTKVIKQDGEKELTMHLKAKLYANPARVDYRRAYTELNLIDLFANETFSPGMAYHVISGGDVDALSFLKLIARRQKSINVLISTWVMAGNDIVYLREMIDAGVITGLDIYVGEIFKTSYGTEWDMLVDLYRDYPGIGHLHKFRNHSKVMAGGGDKFPFVCESSANVNTNPRCEQTTITIDQGLADFYREFYKQIKPEDI